jgi:hypothetical protein
VICCLCFLLKFLIFRLQSVAKFISEIRKHIKLGRQESLFVFVANNVMPQPNATMSQVYAQHKVKIIVVVFCY